MPTLLTQTTGIGVHQRRKLFEMRNQYTLTGADGAVVGAVQQVDQSPFTFLARLLSDLDLALPVTLSITQSDGGEVLRLHKPWFRYAVTVSDGSGTVLGRVTKRVRLGKARFSVADPSGQVLGELKAQNWRARDFVLEAATGQPLARVTKQWRGLVTEMFTDADSYAVTFEPTADERARALALAAALAVDLTMKQKDYN